MIDRQRLISLLVALGYLNAMWRRGGSDGMLAIIIPLILALALIWFPGSISRSAGRGLGKYRFTQATPPLAIRSLGWVLLLAPLVFFTARWLAKA